MLLVSQGHLKASNSEAIAQGLVIAYRLSVLSVLPAFL